MSTPPVWRSVTLARSPVRSSVSVNSAEGSSNRGDPRVIEARLDRNDPPVASKQVQYVRAFTYQPVAFPAHSLLTPPAPYKFIQASPAAIIPTAKQINPVQPTSQQPVQPVQFVPCMCPIAVNVQSNHAELADKRLDETTTTDAEVVVPSGESEK
uniref:Uncharacterized protein n=1 Tax=Anopheles coluzzii TaxID=1518534 RepID=A0A8W7PBQ0_ANOCL